MEHDIAASAIFLVEGDPDFVCRSAVDDFCVCRGFIEERAFEEAVDDGMFPVPFADCFRIV